MSRIVDYYLGISRDQSGRTLDDVLAWPDAQWERCHNHIQWVFPTRTKSQFNRLAPTLTDSDVATFQANRGLRLKVLLSAERFLRFLGSDASGWPAKNNHNNLRITRALVCIRELVTPEAAEEFYDHVIEAWGDDPLRHWIAAIE